MDLLLAFILFGDPICSYSAEPLLEGWVSHIALAVKEFVHLMSLVILSFFPSPLIIRRTTQGARQEEFLWIRTYSHTLSFPNFTLFFPRFPLLSTLPPLFTSCSRSFMYRSEKPATYHRSLERLSYKSWCYTADLTGQRHKDLSVSPSLWLSSSHSCL